MTDREKLYLLSYPPPDANPACQCKGNPMRQMLCQLGHMTECHAPSDCASARCTHLLKYDGAERYRGAEILDAAYWAEANLRWYKDSPEVGVDCACSYCLQAIEGEPLRFVYRWVMFAPLNEEMQPGEPIEAGYLQFKAGDGAELPPLIPELQDLAPAEYLEVRFHEPCALAALPSVYALTTKPVAYEDMPKAS